MSIQLSQPFPRIRRSNPSGSYQPLLISVGLSLAFLLLTGCKSAPKAQGSNATQPATPPSTVQSSAVQSSSTQSPDRQSAKGGTLPSMASYTLEHVKAKQAGGPPTSAQSTGRPLTPGQYCFHKENGENWLSMRLTLTDQQQITGESAGTLTHPEKGKLLYTQAFTGAMNRDQALVKVTTDIDNITQSKQEAWAIDTTTLDMGRVSIDEVPCLEISTNFSSTSF